MTAAHAVAEFDCGVPVLNDWLRRRALKNQIERASRTYVVRHGAAVVGYYSLANGSVLHAAATGRIRRNMPEPIPAMVLGRLAVDRRWGGRWIGAGMLRDAMLRTLQVAEISGVRVLLVHALDGTAKGFYLKHGFHASPIQELTLMLGTAEIEAALRR